MALLQFLVRTVRNFLGGKPPQAPSIVTVQRQRIEALQREVADLKQQLARRSVSVRPPARVTSYAPPSGPPQRFSPLGRTIVPSGRRMGPAAARTVHRPMRQFRPPPGPPPPLPGVFQPGDLGEWYPVSSSWIAALRFVPLGPRGAGPVAAAGADGEAPPAIKNPRDLVGFVDMRVSDGRYPIYRYGPGVKWREFDKWVAAASKGKFWWRVWTGKWSPAKKI